MPYSDKEKTLVDVLYFKLQFTPHELQEMAKRLDIFANILNQCTY